MKKLLSLVMAAVMIVGLLPAVFSVTDTTGVGVGVISETLDFAPLVWMDPNSRIVRHNAADGLFELVERVENYAFEGESIQWRVLVMDKNGAEKISDVYVTVGPVQGEGNDIEANCDRTTETPEGIEEFNAWIYEEELTEFDPNTMAIYLCTFTVESPESMYGEYWVTVEAVDLDGLYGTMDENEYWFLNPVLAITVDGEIDFGVVMPGTLSYSDTLLIGNDADPGSGVLLDMRISGTDFYDPSSSGAMCPTSNVLSLGQFAYYATNGGHETVPGSARVNLVGDPAGLEGYYGIPYETGDPDDREEIIEDDGVITLGGIVYQAGNVLSPGAEIAATFRLFLPEPCNGDFSAGSIFFWGTAI